jgi:hypothetical protein
VLLGAVEECLPGLGKVCDIEVVAEKLLEARALAVPVAEVGPEVVHAPQAVNMQFVFFVRHCPLKKYLHPLPDIQWLQRRLGSAVAEWLFSLLVSYGDPHVVGRDRLRGSGSVMAKRVQAAREERLGWAQSRKLLRLRRSSQASPWQGAGAGPSPKLRSWCCKGVS